MAWVVLEVTVGHTGALSRHCIYLQTMSRKQFYPLLTGSVPRAGMVWPSGRKGFGWGQGSCDV